ncbi:MAG: hypothetical protein AAF458_24440 [Pseudomonadota bacterium]
MANVHALATVLGAPFEVDWRAAPGCMAEYGALFDRMPRFAGRVQGAWDPGLRLREPAWEPAERRVWTGPRAHLAKSVPLLPALATEGFDAALINSPGMSDLTTPQLPAALLRRLKSRFYRSLPVLPELRAQARAIHATWLRESSARLIGVHVRRFSAQHDAADGIAFDSLSPLERFVDVLGDWPSPVRFAVFSNAPEIAAELSQTLGSERAFVARPETAVPTRDAATGVRDALVDLLLLGMCDQVLGTYFSSFSDEAALFGSIGNKTSPLGPAGVAHARANAYHAAGFQLDAHAALLRTVQR